MFQAVVAMGIIVALGFLFVLGIHIYVYAGLFVAGKRLRRRLAAKSRALLLEDAKRLITEGKGTIVVDAPTMSWNIARVWWAPPEATIEKRPTTRNREFCSDKDEVNYDNLIDEHLGVAKLVDPFVSGQRVQTYIQCHFGASEFPFVFTGGVFFQREYQRQLAAEKTAGPPSSESDPA